MILLDRDASDTFSSFFQLSHALIRYTLITYAINLHKKRESHSRGTLKRIEDSYELI